LDLTTNATTICRLLPLPVIEMQENRTEMQDRARPYASAA
jgi:hypothetical protein